MKAFNYIFLLFLFVPVKGITQNQLTSSPYSMFGVGELSNGLGGVNTGMGDVAYGMRDPSLINTVNPAGLVGLDSARLYAETSAFVRSEYYRSGGNSNHTFTGNLSSFTLATKIWKRWYTAVGLKPYSAVGYYFLSTEPLEGTANSYVVSAYQGDGGLSKAYMSNALLLPGNISIGVNLNYLFGTIIQSETQSSISVSQQLYTQNFHADFGLQYQRALGRQTHLTLGAVYGYKQTIKMDNTITVTGVTTQGTYEKRKVTQYIPQFYGVGGTLQHKKLTYALDYTFYEYSVFSSSSSQVKFNDTHEFRAGVSFKPTSFSYENYTKQIVYKAGLNVSTPYYKINGKTGLRYRASSGVDLPVLGNSVNAALFYDFTRIQGKLNQRIIGGMVTFTLSERMFRVRL